MSSTVSSEASILLVLLLLLSLMLHDASAEWVETAKLLDSDGDAGDNFGFSLAIDNDTLVAGAWRDDINGAIRAGSATLFEWSDDGAWVAQQKLTASDPEEFEWFGYSVAISNGVVAVGVPYENDGRFDAGAVYLYGKGAGGVWSEKQKLIHSDATGGDEFGWSLAMKGSTLVVGAPAEDSLSGAVYSFTRLDDIWTPVARLTASDRSADDEFGHSVAIDADTILIGAPFDGGLGVVSGSAFVFQRDGQGGSWTQVAKLTPADGQSLDQFGLAVAIEEGTSFVGSFNKADGSNVGAVYQFEEEGRTWTEKNKLVARDFATNDAFGFNLAFRHGTLVVGASALEQDGGTGAVYVFQKVSGVWKQREKLVAGDGAVGDRFGSDVAVDDGMIIAGAYGDNSWQGSVYAFEWRDSETSARPSVATEASTSQPTWTPGAQAAAPVSTKPSGLQPIAIVFGVAIAFLTCAGTVWKHSRRNNDHRVVATDSEAGGLELDHFQATNSNIL